MAEVLLERARVALCDTAYMNRQATLGGLQSLGFANVEPFARADQLAGALETSTFDLIVAELKTQEAAVFRMVSQIRARRLCANPFVVILLTTWDMTQDTVRQVLSTGADDLLSRPFSIKQLQQRITAGVHQRKPYVVTCDYLGPSRRTTQRTPEADGIFEVPNTLQAQVTGNGMATTTEIELAWRHVLKWRVFRYGERLTGIAQKLAEVTSAAGDAKRLHGVLGAFGACATGLEEEAGRSGLPGTEQIVAYTAVLKRILSRVQYGQDATQGAENLAVIRELVDHIVERTAPLRPEPLDTRAPARPDNRIALIN